MAISEEPMKKRERPADEDDQGDANDVALMTDDRAMEDVESGTRSAVSPSPSKSLHDGGRSKQHQVVSPELLKVYYSRLFPFELLHSWLSYDPCVATTAMSSKKREVDQVQSYSSTVTFNRREFSFTIEPSPGDEIYIRYQSFSSLDELRTCVIHRNPTKIDIGAVFTHPPKDHNSILKSKFLTVQRELVFDIDLTDYDYVRMCGCANADICPKCWKMMSMAIHVLDEGLRTDFEFRNLAWFYSGRRGVHCWVCDEKARMLSNEARSAVAHYFEIAMESDTNKAAGLLYHPLHPMLKRSYNTLEKMFIEHIIPESGQGLLASEQSWSKLLDSLPDAADYLRKKLKDQWGSEDTSYNPSSAQDKWKELVTMIQRFLVGKEKASKKSARISISERTRIEMWKYEVVFKYCYPRLDINVSKMQNHLLKSPFCIHPKTGRVCVPIDVSNVDEFDPFTVPTVAQLVQELDDYEGKGGDDGRVEDSRGNGNGDNEMLGEKKRAGLDPLWKKTSLKKTFELFEKDFLLPMKKALLKASKDSREERAALTADF